ncbi:hypothetical protein L8N14_025105, partial [Serratia marcescens]|nr:hypothetical protein [Serratia marcescens]
MPGIIWRGAKPISSNEDRPRRKTSKTRRKKKRTPAPKKELSPLQAYINSLEDYEQTPRMLVTLQDFFPEEVRQLLEESSDDESEFWEPPPSPAVCNAVSIAEIPEDATENLEFLEINDVPPVPAPVMIAEEEPVPEPAAEASSTSSSPTPPSYPVPHHLNRSDITEIWDIIGYHGRQLVSLGHRINEVLMVVSAVQRQLGEIYLPLVSAANLSSILESDDIATDRKGKAVATDDKTSTSRKMSSKKKAKDLADVEDDFCFKRNKVKKIFYQALEMGLELPPVTRATAEQAGMGYHPNYCLYHRRLGHPIEDCIAFKRWFQQKIDNDEVTLASHYYKKPKERKNGATSCYAISSGSEISLNFPKVSDSESEASVNILTRGGTGYPPRQPEPAKKGKKKTAEAPAVEEIQPEEVAQPPKLASKLNYNILAHLRKLPSQISIFDALVLSKDIRDSLIY